MYGNLQFITTIISASCLYKHVRCQTADDVERLYKDKVWFNNPNILPVQNQSQAINVSLNFNLISINSFNEVQEKLSFTAWMNVFWTDELLSWDKRQYGHVDIIWPPENRVWKPNIAVKNTVDELRHLAANNNVLSVRSSGLTMWSPGSAFNTHCEVDTSNYPFDKQLCQVEIIIWGHELRYVDLYPASDHVGLNMYKENGEWIITYSSVYRVLQNPDKGERPVIIVSIHLKRRSTYIVISVIFPSFVLSLLGVFVFAIPLDSGEKISFSVTILLAFGVMMTFIMDTMPKTSKHISSLVLYLVSNTVIGAVFVSLAVLLTNLHHRDKKIRPIPKWLVVISKQLERVFRLNSDVPRKPDQQFQLSLKNTSCSSADINYYFQNVTWKYISNTLDAAIFRIAFPGVVAAFIIFVSILYANKV